MTRRLEDNLTSSVWPNSMNALWLEDHEALGEPQPYIAITREVEAAALYQQLEDVADQHAVHLNAVPLVRMADAAEVTEKLAASGSWKLRVGADDAPLSQRVQSYFTHCGDSNFGLSADMLRDMLELSKRPLS